MLFQYVHSGLDMDCFDENQYEISSKQLVKDKISHPHMRLLVCFMLSTCSLKQSRQSLYLFGQQNANDSLHVRQ
jgi:hypothetical protein